MTKETTSTKNFPNGFISWRETFFEIVEGIVNNPDNPAFKGQLYQYGRCVLYDIAEEWADEFELLHEGRNWDGEFFDEIDIFINNKLGK
jgi:hypothetical protein